MGRRARNRRKKWIRRGAVAAAALVLCAAGLILFLRLKDRPLAVSDWRSVLAEMAGAEAGDVELRLVKDTYEVDAALTVPEGVRLRLVTPAGHEAALTRADGYEGALIESAGALVLGGEDSGPLILSGRRGEITAGDALVRVTGGEAALTGVTLRDNAYSGGKGGGLSVTGEAVRITLRRCEITGCSAKYGGGLFCGEKSAVLALTDCIISGCSSTASGGGIYAYGQMTVDGDSRVTGNKAKTYGGGMMVKTGLVMTGGEVSGNQVTAGPGGGVRCDGPVTLNGTLVTGNSASLRGGGLDGYNVEFVLVDAWVTGNTAPTAPDTWPENWQDQDWMQTLDLTPLTLTPLKTIAGDDHLQGLTLTDRFLVFAMVYSNAENNEIRVWDRDTLEEVSVTKANFKHANDMTFNPDTGEIIVSNVTDRNDTAQGLAIFRLDEAGAITDLRYVDTAHAYGGIAWDADDGYCIGRSLEMIYVMDREFRELYSFQAETTLTRQGLAYFDHEIYFPAWEHGWTSSYQTVYNSREKNSNLIYVYSMEGELLRTLYISGKEYQGELEGLSFEADGSAVLGFKNNENDDDTDFFRCGGLR